MLGDPNLSTARGYITSVVSALTGAGDTRIHFIEFPMQDGTDGYGCDWHPSLATHQKMSDQLVPAMRSAMGW